jgi:D-alanyl-D-alanine carboxypeptidase
MLYILHIFFLFFTSQVLGSPAIIDFYKTQAQQNSLALSDVSFCLEDFNQKVWSHNIDKKMMPASLTKAYTSYVALNIFGKDLILNTSSYFKGNTLYLVGDDDGYFTSNDLKKIIPPIKIKHVIFDSHFFLNGAITPEEIKQQLFRFLKIKPDAVDLISTQNLNYYKTYASPPLLSHIKNMNIHSYNRYAFTLFKKINNDLGFNEMIWNDFQADVSQVRFMEGSGGERNYSTCNVTLKMFKALDNKMHSYGLDLSDVLNIAPINGGTLKNRFIEAHYREKVIAKTGTLPDFGVSTIGGAINTAKGRVYFTIMSQSNKQSIQRMKQFEDLVIKYIIAYFSAK